MTLLSDDRIDYQIKEWKRWISNGWNSELSKNAETNVKQNIEKVELYR